MLVKFLIKNAQTRYEEEFNYIETKFSEYVMTLKRPPCIYEEVKFLLDLKDTVYKEGYGLMQDGKTEDGVKRIALSNIIHSMLFDSGFYKQI